MCSKQFRRVAKSMELEKKVRPSHHGLYSFSANKALYFMAIACIVFVIVFAYVPLFGWIIAFMDYRPTLGLSNSQFVGFKYFLLAVKQPDILSSLRNTLIFAGFGVITGWICVIFSLSVSEIKQIHFKRITQTITTFPNFISWILMFSIVYALFSTTDGVINKILLNIDPTNTPLNPLANGKIVYLFQTSLGLWKGMGFSAIVYLAALAGVDPGLYEAAEIDGAGRFAKIKHIKLPAVLPTYFTLLVIGFGALLNTGFEQFYIFSNPMVGERMQVLDLYIYKIGMLQQSYPLATAIGLLKTFVSLVLLTFANLMSKLLRGTSIL